MFRKIALMIRGDMPIPALNDLGLLPAGVHDCTIGEVPLTFCQSPARANVWDAFVRFIDWVETMPGPVTVLVDGSFVTDKVMPSDVDVIIDISNCTEVDQNVWLGAYHRDHQRIKQNFMTDFYPIIDGHGHDFTAFFQYIRVDDAFRRGAPDGTRKGILRLVE